MKNHPQKYFWAIAVLFMIMSNTLIAADDELKTEDEKLFYFLGVSVATNLKPLNLSDEEVVLVQRGIRDSLAGTEIQLDAETYGARLGEVAQERMQAQAVNEKASAASYVEKMAAEEGAITTDSGIVIHELVVGTGDSPTATSTVKVHYHGTLRDGSVFDSSVDRGEPFTSTLNKVIPCWGEAIPTMKEGGKSKITCPSNLAYGDRGAGAIPPGAALTFEVELIEVVN